MSNLKICDRCKYSVNPDRLKGTTWCDFWHFNFNQYDTCSLFEDKTEKRQITFDDILEPGK